MVQIFISSTIDDLVGERDKVKETLQVFPFETYLSEIEGADWRSACTKCFSEIEGSDVFILIVGVRYGFVPERNDDFQLFDGRTSVTHAEFKRAVELNKPILIYIKDEKTREEGADRFVQELEDFYQGYSRKKFCGSTELADSVRIDIVQLVTQILRGTYRYPCQAKPTIAICSNRNEVFHIGARMICQVLETETLPVLGLMPGRTAGGIYDKLIQILDKGKHQHGIEELRSFHVAEHFGVIGSSPCSYQEWMNSALYRRIQAAFAISVNRKRTHFIPGVVAASSIESECQRYDSLVSSHTIHLQLLGDLPPFYVPVLMRG